MPSHLLPAGWKFHNQNVTFQQWSPEDPEGPRLLMFVQGSQIRYGGSGGLSGTVGSIASPIFHDHHRIASTYVLAEPANW